MKPSLTRSSVRDLVLLLCCASALFRPIGAGHIATGFAMLVIGCALHVLSKGILVRNAVLCENGIYGFVRHPYYLSNYVIDSAFCVLSGNAYLLLIYPFLFFWAYGPTLRKEEALLRSFHEAAFVRHSAEVPQVFPDRTSFKDWKKILEGFSRSRITWKEIGRIARFFSLGFLLLLLHELQADGLAGLSSIVRPTWLDYDESLFAALVILLYGTSLVFLRRSRKAHDRLKPGEQDTSASRP